MIQIIYYILNWGIIMKTGKGIVKKYSREYNRTLKNGERKKYTTEQIQITVPKTEDIYENEEEVLIIPQSEIENFYNLEKELDSYKITNYFYMKEVEELEQKINDMNPSEYEKIINELKDEIYSLEQLNTKNKDDKLNILKEENSTIKSKHSRLIEENENLKNKFVNIKIENENLKTKYSSIKEENKNLKTKCSNLKEKHADIKDSYNNITIKYDQLKQENLNTKTSYAEMFAENEDLEKDYDNLRLDYNDLVDKYNSLEEELYKLKTTKTRDEYIANRVKEFILNKEI